MYQVDEDSPLTRSARQNFVKKVYSVLSIQLAATVGMTCLTFSSRSFAKFQLKQEWTFWVALIGSIITLLALFLGNISRKVPMNYLVLGIFTLCESYMVSFVCFMYTPASVLLTATATLAATLGLTYYAMTTKQDFTSFRFIAKGIVGSLLWIVLSVSLINLLFLRSSFISMAISAFFAVVYSVYLLVDTQMVLGGKNHQISLDDYILGAAIIYVDVISLFLKLLRLLGKKKED